MTYRSYIYRIQKQDSIYGKRERKLQDLSCNTVQYILSPFSVNIIKFVSPDLKVFTDLMKEKSMGQNGKQQIKINISWFVKLYIGFYVVLYGVNMNGLVLLSYIIDYRVRPTVLVLIGIYLILPQTKQYFKIIIRKNNGIKNTRRYKIAVLIKFLVYIPCMVFFHAFLIVYPLQSQAIPLILGLKENWLLNYVSSVKLVLMVQMYNSFFLIVSYNIIQNESNFLINESVDREEIRQFKDSLFLYIVIGFYAVYSMFNTLSFIQYFYEKLDEQLIGKSKKKRKIQI